MSDTGEFRGLLLDRACLLGSPSGALTEVQTLDECLLIVERRDDGLYFDEDLRGWHAYGVDACCRAIEAGGRNYVLSMPVWHDSKATNLNGLVEAHEFVWRKHKEALPKIYTTCGAIPGEFVQRRERLTTTRRALRWWRRRAGFAFGAPVDYVHQSGEALERLTEGEASVDVLHRRAAVADIEARGFVPHPRHPRRVLHRFGELSHREERANCVVVLPELTAHMTTGKIDEVARGAGRVLACVNVEDRKTNPDLWRVLRDRSVAQLVVRKSDVTINYDGMAPIVRIFELKNGLAYAADGAEQGVSAAADARGGVD